jgi:hypothetical protein
MRRMPVTERRLSRREAANALVQAFRRQRPAIVPLDGQFALRLPWRVWLQIAESLTPLADPLDASAVVQASGAPGRLSRAGSALPSSRN